MKTYAILPLLCCLALSAATASAQDSPKRKPAPSYEDSRTWLGVATTTVAPSLRDHLELEEGFGVEIQDTMEGSPAEKAGLKKHDILVKFDDQMLISPEHLSLLVRRLKDGDQATLTVIRKGGEKTIDVTFEKTSMAKFKSIAPSHGGRFNHPNPKEWQDAMKRQQDHWQRMMERQHPPHSTPPQKKEHSKKDKDSSGRPPAVSVKPGFPLQVFGSEGIIKIDNQEGEVTITQKDGEHHIEIRNKDGEEVYQGIYDPESGVSSLPEKAQDHLKKMKLDELEVLTPPADTENASCPVEESSGESLL